MERPDSLKAGTEGVEPVKGAAELRVLVDRLVDSRNREVVGAEEVDPAPAPQDAEEQVLVDLVAERRLVLEPLVCAALGLVEDNVGDADLTENLDLRHPVLQGVDLADGMRAADVLENYPVAQGPSRWAGGALQLQKALRDCGDGEVLPVGGSHREVGVVVLVLGAVFLAPLDGAVAGAHGPLGVARVLAALE